VIDGLWKVERTGGVVPPLIGVRKRIQGDRGDTRVGALLRVPFRVDGLTFRYLRPFDGFVDQLEPEGHGFRGRATFRGREFGRFRMTRLRGAGRP
jgi:hypothetical protein